MDLTVCIIAVLVIILVIFGAVISLHKARRKQSKLLKEELLQQIKTKQDTPNNPLIGLRIQAYERMTLFLERINPPNLIPRIAASGQSVLTFQSLLLQSIREEYEHNLSQQLYISDLAWESCKTAKENIIQLIIQSAASFNNADDASLMAGKILTSGFEKENNPVENALQLLKKEIREQL